VIWLLLIGNDKDKLTYFMYKKFACDYSSLFDAVFNGARMEIIDLQGVSWPESFGIIQAWMYTQKLESPFPGLPFDATDLCDIWILADCLVMPELQNEVMKTLIEQTCR
jgi:hypothetical protein